ncbi:MAG: IclR family transcriptional regulator [Firmicutes bacterium]|nr:IclR family transcriptional regulator [Bacillota bacterium]MBQ4181805.1 IclR family transcriptional regulator [Bacillota bacterium]
MPARSTTPASNQTADKLLSVMEAFACQPEPVKLSDLARELDMNVSTLYRFTSSLQKCGYVNQLADGRYEISLKLCYLADRIQRRKDVTLILHPFASEACSIFGESAHIAVQDGPMIVYTDNVVSQAQTLTIQQHIGKTAPMYVTGIGKLFLSQMDEKALDDYIEKSGLKAYTPNTITTKDAMLSEFAFLRENGFLYDNEECEPGVRCVAVPVRDFTGRIVAGISISGPAPRLTDDAVARHIGAFKDIASRASEALGYMGQDK